MVFNWVISAISHYIIIVFQIYTGYVNEFSSGGHGCDLESWNHGIIGSKNYLVNGFNTTIDCGNWYSQLYLFFK